MCEGEIVFHWQPRVKVLRSPDKRGVGGGGRGGRRGGAVDDIGFKVHDAVQKGRHLSVVATTCTARSIAGQVACGGKGLNLWGHYQ